MTKLVFHDGIGIIGANKISLASADGTGILLDFGYNYDIDQKFFIYPFLEPRRFQVLYDSFILGMLPLPKGILEGIYRKDLHIYSTEMIESKFNINMLAEPKITHVLISHAHSDHISGIQYLHPNIEVVADSVTLDVLKYYTKRYRGNTKFTGIFNYFPYFQVDEEGNRKRRTESIKRTIFSIPHKKLVFLPKNPNFLVAFFPTDHSLIGAGAYLIYDISTNSRIVYTGDLRLHGILRHQVEEFITAAYNFKPDALIIEGTRIGIDDNEEIESEADVKDKIKAFLSQIQAKDEKAMIFFDCSRSDMYRMRSFYQAAASVGRELVIPPNSYHLLLQCIHYKYPGFEDVSLKEIRVYLPKRSWGLYEAEDYAKDRLLKAFFSITKTTPKSEVDIDEERDEDIDSEEENLVDEETQVDIDDSRFIRAAEIQANPGNFLVFIDLYECKELIDLDPSQQSYYIQSHSEWEGLQNQVYDEKKANWFKLFKIPLENIFKAHCSGHISKKHIQELIQLIQPKKVFPIHSPHPEKFGELKYPSQCELIFPQVDETYEI
ncbi:MAG: MBL fold metallo-hydrolase [Promethearchaeota archaeon]